MSMRRIAALHAALVFLAILANASSSKNTIRITVLESSSRASTADNNNGVPQNCEQLTFDAYCRSTTNVPVVSTLLVQEGNEPPFRIRCTMESKYSRCVPLPKGATFDARREKHGITVYYIDDKGKPRRQLYTLVAGSLPAVSADTAPPVTNSKSASQLPVSASPASAAVAPAAPVAGPNASENAGGNVKCSFSSTPLGAEITIDGKYVGSTPSEIAVSTGTHVVGFSLPGFAEWKRDLTVTPGSQLTVSAILQKQ